VELGKSSVTQAGYEESLRKLYHYVHRRIWDGDHLNLVKHFGGLPCDNIENLRAPPDNGDAPPSQEEPTSVLLEPILSAPEPSPSSSFKPSKKKRKRGR